MPVTNNDQSSEVNADKFYNRRPVQILQHQKLCLCLRSYPHNNHVFADSNYLDLSFPHSFLFYLLTAPYSIWDLSSQTRNGTLVAWSFNHWTTKEVPPQSYFNQLAQGEVVCLFVKSLGSFFNRKVLDFSGSIGSYT